MARRAARDRQEPGANGLAQAAEFKIIFRFFVTLGLLNCLYSMGFTPDTSA